jgi:hypothetical protein
MVIHITQEYIVTDYVDGNGDDQCDELGIHGMAYTKASSPSTIRVLLQPIGAIKNLKLPLPLLPKTFTTLSSPTA